MFWLKFHYFDFLFKDLNGHLCIGTFPYIKYEVFPPCLLCPKGIAYKATKVFYPCSRPKGDLYKASYLFSISSYNQGCDYF
jgi:hypothetical protein